MTWIWIWLGITVSLLLLEIIEKKLNLNYFIFSSIFVLATTKIFKSFIVQFLIFIVVGLILYLYKEKILVIMEKLYKKDMVGREAKVVKVIKKGQVGIVKINKLKYKATALNEIKEGTIVKIIDVSEFILEIEKAK